MAGKFFSMRLLGHMPGREGIPDNDSSRGFQWEQELAESELFAISQNGGGFAERLVNNLHTMDR
jgi:hypothetical protein